MRKSKSGVVHKLWYRGYPPYYAFTYNTWKRSTHIGWQLVFLPVCLQITGNGSWRFGDGSCQRRVSGGCRDGNLQCFGVFGFAFSRLVFSVRLRSLDLLQWLTTGSQRDLGSCLCFRLRRRSLLLGGSRRVAASTALLFFREDRLEARSGGDST